jgi:serine/threonine protein kinase
MRTVYNGCPMPLTPGAKLGPYEIQSQLGAGGMGEVYRSRDTRLDRVVAVKVLNSSLVASPDLKARFDREARTISQLNHPHICTLFDIGHQDGTDYLVMEFLQGESLADRLKRGPIALGELVKAGSEIADALECAHRAGIVHRDLKPGNIMLTNSGAKLLDFGLAKPTVAGTMAGSGTAPLLSAAMTMTSPPTISFDPARRVGGNRTVHVAGAATRQRSRCTQRHFRVRRRTVRDGHRKASLRGQIANQSGLRGAGG